MTDSLLLGGVIELLGGGVQSQQPQCTGAVFRLGQSFDLNAPQPASDVVASLLVDGSRPFGTRANNRTVTLPVVVFGPTRDVVVAAVELLLEVIDQQTWSMQWTRDGGNPAVFSCFRAQPAVVTYDLLNARDPQIPAQALTISFPALPYLTTDEPQTLTFTSPASGTAAPVPPATLDTYGSVSPGWSQSGYAVVGSDSAHWSSAGGGYPSYQASIDETSIEGETALTVWVGLAATSLYNYWNWRGGQVTFGVTLTDVNGDQLQFGAQASCAASDSTSAPKWQQVTIPIPSSSSFDFAAVVAYQITAWAYYSYGSPVLPADLWLNDLVAQPPSQSYAASSRAWLATLSGILGSAHAPAGLQLQCPESEPVATTYTPGTYNIVIPSGGATIRGQLWGAAGSGQSLTAAGEGNGGSGCGYAEEPALALAAGTYVLTVPSAPSAGSNGSPCTLVQGGTTYIEASGGLAGTSSGPGAANDTSANTIHYPGGAGAAGGTGSGTPSLRQKSSAKGTGSTVTVTLGEATAAGSALLVKIAASNGGGSSCQTVSSVELGGSAGNFSQIGAETSAAEEASVAAYAWLDPDCASGQTSVVVAMANQNAPATTVMVEEWVNVPAAGAVDVVQSGKGSSSSWSTGDGAETAQAAEVWSGFVGWFSWTSPTLTGPGGSWTNTSQITQGDSDEDYLAMMSGYQVTSAEGTPVYAGSESGGEEENSWCALVVTLKGAPAAYSGAGGSSAGPASEGSAGSAADGGAAPSGGAAGANGVTSAGPGNAGTAPGGGGSGALSSGADEAGGAGGAGQAIITVSTTELAQFANFVIHVPSAEAPATLVPYVSVGNGGDTPNGGTAYPVPAPATGVQARFGGTYGVLAVASSFNSPAASRTITITINEYEYCGGTSVQTVVARTFIPDTSTPSDNLTGLNGYVMVGTVTLPQRYVDPDNTQSYFTVTVTDSNTSDRWLDVLFLDLAGQTVLVNMSGSGYDTYYIDVPDTDQDLGPLLGTQSDRSAAASVMAYAKLAGGPVYVNPGSNMLLAYSTQGAPSLVATYRPQYRIDRSD